MGAQRTIVLKGDLRRYHGEATVLSAFKPGHLIEKTSADVLQKLSLTGGVIELLIAKESALDGRTVDDAYAADDVGFFHTCQNGDIVHGRLAAGAPAVTKADNLASAGDGTVVKISGNGNLYQSVAASAAVTNTTTPTAFDKSYTIPANTLKAGDVITIRGQGIATATNSTDTLAVAVKIGSTTIVTIPATDVADNDVFDFNVTMVIRTAGASGTFVADCTYAIGAAGTATKRIHFKASTAIDTTVTQAITVVATWSVASASNSVRLDILGVERATLTSAQQPLFKAHESKDNSLGASEVFIQMRTIL